MQRVRSLAYDSPRSRAQSTGSQRGDLLRARGVATSASGPRELGVVPMVALSFGSVLLHVGVSAALPDPGSRPPDDAVAFSVTQMDWELEEPPRLESEEAPPEAPEPESTPRPEPDIAEPDVAEPDVAEPDVAEPDVAEPDVAEPEEPATSENTEPAESDDPPGDPEARAEAAETDGAPQATLAHSTRGGLAVDLPTGAGTDGAARGTQRRGQAVPAPAVDRRALIRGWIRRVSQSIGPAVYTRTLRRALLEGTVHVALKVDPRGRIRDVRVRRSGGHELLDEAALAHVRAHERVPVPDEHIGWERLWERQELTIPIRYRLGR